jgi:hypothetical protein
MFEIISNDEYLTFKAPLIETNKILETNRFYSKEVVEESIDKLIDRIKAKELCGEFGTFSSCIPANCLTVHYKNASHVFIDVEWNGDTLIGTMETLNTYNGKLIKPMIVNKVPLKMVMRSIGDLRNENNYNIIIGPLHIITWDIILRHPAWE